MLEEWEGEQRFRGAGESIMLWRSRGRGIKARRKVNGALST